MRAALVAALVGAVVSLSFRIGPAATGMLAAFPVVFTSIMFILHRRVGGPAAAAVLANATLGLVGFGMAVLTLHLLAEPLGSPAALALALCVAVVWNLGLYGLRRVGMRRLTWRSWPTRISCSACFLKMAMTASIVVAASLRRRAHRPVHRRADRLAADGGRRRLHHPRDGASAVVHCASAVGQHGGQHRRSPSSR